MAANSPRFRRCRARRRRQMVQSDAIAMLAVTGHRPGQVRRVQAGVVTDLQHHLLGLQAALAQDALEREAMIPAHAGQMTRVNVEPEQAAAVGLQQEVQRVHGAAQAIQIDKLFAGGGQHKGGGRAQGAGAPFDGQQGFVAVGLIRVQRQQRLKPGAQA